MTDYALIEKAKEYCCNKCCYVDACKPMQNTCEEINAFIAGATWQREQLEAEIENLKKFILDTEIKHRGICDMHFNMRQDLIKENDKLKSINKIMNDQLMKNSVADLTVIIKDIKTQDPREQLEAKILELEKQVEYYIQLKDFHLCDIKHLRAENKTIREQLIKELREAGDIIKIVKENVIHYTVGKQEQKLDYKMSQFLAKLDLLEKGGE